MTRHGSTGCPDSGDRMRPVPAVRKFSDRALQPPYPNATKGRSATALGPRRTRILRGANSASVTRAYDTPPGIGRAAPPEKISCLVRGKCSIYVRRHDPRPLHRQAYRDPRLAGRAARRDTRAERLARPGGARPGGGRSSEPRPHARRARAGQFPPRASWLRAVLGAPIPPKPAPKRVGPGFVPPIPGYAFPRDVRPLGCRDRGAGGYGRFRNQPPAARRRKRRRNRSRKRCCAPLRCPPGRSPSRGPGQSGTHMAGRSVWNQHAAAHRAMAAPSGRSGGACARGRSCRMARKFGADPGRLTRVHLVTTT